MSDDEMTPIERLNKLKREMKDSSSDDTVAPKKKKRKVKVKVKTTAKKGAVAKKPVKAVKKGKKTEKAEKTKKKPVKVAKKKTTAKSKAPAKNKKAASKAAKPAKAATSREQARDRKGDGLTPLERKIIAFIADADEPVTVVTIAKSMFGKNCISEGPNSYRTIRNGLRFPVRYGMIEAVKGSRGAYKIGKEYKRVKGNLSKLAERYRNRVEKERKAS